MCASAIQPVPIIPTLSFLDVSILLSPWFSLNILRMSLSAIDFSSFLKIEAQKTPVFAIFFLHMIIFYVTMIIAIKKSILYRNVDLLLNNIDFLVIL